MMHKITARWSGPSNPAGNWTDGNLLTMYVSDYRTLGRSIVEYVKQTHSIGFSDGTSLILSIEPVNRGKNDSGDHGYMDLIRECAAYGVASVDDLYKARQAKALKIIEANIRQFDVKVSLQWLKYWRPSAMPDHPLSPNDDRYIHAAAIDHMAVPTCVGGE